MSEVQEFGLRILMSYEAVQEGLQQTSQIAPEPDEIVRVEVTEENYDDPGTIIFDTTTPEVEDMIAHLGLQGMIEE